MGIKTFIKCWLVYWLLIFIAPFRSEAESPWVGIAIQITFFLAVIAGYAILQSGIRHQKIEFSPPISNEFYICLFWFSIISAFAGIFSLTFDRIVIQGISFSDGLAVAREQWRVAGEERGGGISSIFSLLGYLLAPAFYYSIINLVIYRTLHHKKYKLKWLIVIVLVLWNSVITGGRSVAFVAIIIFVASRIYSQQFFFNQEINVWRRIFILKKSTLLRNVVILFLLGYSLYIFKARSEAGSMEVQKYVNEALDGLGLEMYPSIQNIFEYLPFSDIFYLSTLFLGYLLHSYVVTTKIFFYPYENNSLVIFVGLGLLLAKVGLISTPNTDWFLGGAFPSLPGSLYLQGGFLLMISFGLILGLGTRLVTLYLYRYPYSSLLLFLYIIFLAIMITSPVLLIFDSLMFPFILIQFVVFSILMKYRFRLTF